METLKWGVAPSSTTKYGTSGSGSKAKVPGSAFKIPVLDPMQGHGKK